MFFRICFVYFFLLTLLPLKEKSAFSALLGFSTQITAIVITIILVLLNLSLKNTVIFSSPAFIDITLSIGWSFRSDACRGEAAIIIAFRLLLTSLFYYIGWQNPIKVFIYSGYFLCNFISSINLVKFSNSLMIVILFFEELFLKIFLYLLLFKKFITKGFLPLHL